jgi:hypothetical protein
MMVARVNSPAQYRYYSCSKMVLLNLVQLIQIPNWIKCCVYALCPSLRRFIACLVL